MVTQFELLASSGEKNVPQIDRQQAIASFDIRNFLDRLQPTMELNKYNCLVCQGHNLSIDPETGNYKCFNGCECRNIREAVSLWEKVRSGREAHTLPRVFEKSRQSQRYKPPVPIPEGNLVVQRLPETPNNIPQPVKPQHVPPSVKKALMGKDVSDEELNSVTVITYDYGEGKFAHRFECPLEANTKGREKTFSVSRVNQKTKTRWSKGEYAWSAYRLDEAIAAMKQVVDGIPILLHLEGEKYVGGK